MDLAFTGLDWLVLGGYVIALATAGYYASRRSAATTEDYFLAGQHVPTWLVAVSVISTTQSAATFLGVPDNAYRGNYTYLASNIGALIAAFIVATWLIPRYYALGVTTVYELLEQRFDARARRAAAAMYLVGRIFASGARLFLAAIAVSMVVFLDIAPDHLLLAAAMLALFGVAFTLSGGLNAVVWSDLVQVVLYVGAALIVLVLLWTNIPLTTGEMVSALRHAPDGSDKLMLFDTSLDFSRPFTLFAVVTGIVLLNIGNAGLDQDTTQRFLSCKDTRHARRALYVSAVAAVPVVLIFLAIGSLLHITYDRPELMGGNAALAGEFAGEKITIFMAYILSAVPPGVRGLVTVGVIAAAAINSGLISMSAVAVNDFYRPYRERHGGAEPAHYVRVGRVVAVLLALTLLVMAMICFYWQRYSEAPLLDFVLSVMTFAYSGLLGVYATAVFTRRGSSRSVVAALATGFSVTLLQQAYVVDLLGLPAAIKDIAFPWQLCVGTLASFLVCIAGRSKSVEARDAGAMARSALGADAA